MGIPTSSVAVLNIALDYLKAAAASDITSPTLIVEKIGARHYDLTRKAVLRSFPWSFAQKQRTVTRDALYTSSGNQYADSYRLPNDCIRVLFIGDTVDDTKNSNYALIGKAVMLNNSGATSLNLRYIYDITNVNDFDPMFTELLALELAIRMAKALDGKINTMAQLRQWRNEKVSEVRAIDSQENPIKVIRNSAFTSSRYAAGAGYYSADIIVEV